MKNTVERNIFSLRLLEFSKAYGISFMELSKKIQNKKSKSIILKRKQKEPISRSLFDVTAKELDNLNLNINYKYKKDKNTVWARNIDISPYILSYQKNHGLSISEIAKKVGCSELLINNSLKNKVSFNTAKKILTKLNVSTEEIKKLNEDDQSKVKKRYYFVGKELTRIIESQKSTQNRFARTYSIDVAYLNRLINKSYISLKTLVKLQNRLNTQFNMDNVEVRESNLNSTDNNDTTIRKNIEIGKTVNFKDTITNYKKIFQISDDELSQIAKVSVDYIKNIEKNDEKVTKTFANNFITNVIAHYGTFFNIQ